MKIGTIKLESDGFYHITSVYFALEKEPINEVKGTNCNNILENEDYINLFSYELNGIHEINFFLEDKKFEEIFGRDIHNEKESIFQKQILLTIHIHDRITLNKNMDCVIYYVINLNIDKIVKSKKSENFGLNFKVKTCDEKFIFSKASEEDIWLNRLFQKIVSKNK